MKTRILLGLMGLAALLGPGRAGAQFIWVNVSCKAIVEPATGLPSSYVTTNLAADGLRYANELLARNHRGYRLRLLEDLTIGGSTDSHDPSTWNPFQLNPANHKFLEEEFRADAYTNHPTMYGWNYSALNLFLTTFPAGASGGAFCASCSGGRLSDYIANGSAPRAEHGLTVEQWFGSYILHEVGHFFSLTHTFGGAACYTNPQGDCLAPVPGNDEFSDTLTDVQNISGCNCWTVDSLSWTNFNMSYASLSAPEHAFEKLQVDNAWHNLMSYHDSWEAYLSEQQLNHWSDTANYYRQHLLSGVTLYVSPDGNDTFSGLHSTMPKHHLQAALDAASSSGGDIVLLQPGKYNERTTFRRPATLRATKNGWAFLGLP